MSFREAAISILGKAKRPLSATEIYDLAIQRGLIETKGKTPESTLYAIIFRDIKDNGDSSIFQKVGKGKFALRSKSSPNFRKNTYKEAAYAILKENKRPMRFEEIATIALKNRMLSSVGKTPKQTMAAQLYIDVKDKDSVFVLLGKSLFGLKEWDVSIIQKQIEAEEQRKLNSEIRSTKERSIVGDPISNVNGLIYGPRNENGVIFLFAKLQEKLGIVIESIQVAFPDARGRRKTNKGWEEIWIEFEYRSSNFQQHGHDPKECDLIVCWEHDWPECPLEVIELKKEVTR